MKNFLSRIPASARDFIAKIVLAFVLLSAIVAPAFGAAIPAPSPFKRVGTSIRPVTAGDTLGASGARISAGYFTTLDATTIVGSIGVGGAVDGDLTVSGNSTLGDAGADAVTFNAATQTYANDTAVTLSGGVNGINFDSDTLSIDATNNRVGIGTAAPSQSLTVGADKFTVAGASGNVVTAGSITATGALAGSNFSGTSSGTNTGDQTSVSGNAGTATALETARTINGTSFDGTANITVTAAAGTLTGSTLNSTVTASSLTSLGTISTGVWNGTIITSAYGGTGNGFTKFTGPTTSEKTFTLPNASATILTDGSAVTVAQGGTGVTSTTAYAVLTGGTTSTGALQSVSGLGTSGQVLTSNGAGALPTWQNAAGGSFSWGATASGTTADGLGLTLSNSSADGAAGLKITSGDTQASQPVGLSILSGSSGNSAAILTKGKYGTTCGDAGTSTCAATFWDNTASATSKLAAFGNGTSYTENAWIKADGSASFGASGTTVAISSGTITVNKVSGNSILTLGTGGGGGTVGDQVKAVYTGGGLTSNYTMADFSLDPGSNNGSNGKAVVNATQVQGSYPIAIFKGVSTSGRDSFTWTASSADQNGADIQVTRTHGLASTDTESSGSQAGRFKRTTVTTNASSNYTMSTPTFSIEQVATQTSGTLTVSGSILDLLAPSAASFTGNLINAKVGGTSYFKVDNTGKVTFQHTITAGGTTGAQTINKPSFTVNFAAAATSLVVTNSLVTANSNPQCTVQTNDTTLTAVQAVPGSGTLTLYANAAATGETRVGCIVFD